MCVCMCARVCARPNNLLQNDIYIYIYIYIIMIKISGKVEKSDIYNGFNGNISLFIYRTSSKY